MYATTRYNFVRLKAMQKISPLEELVGGDLPPSSSQRLTGMHYMKKIVRLATSQWFSAVTPPITVHHDTEILLKVVLNTIILTLQIASKLNENIILAILRKALS
jgi:hypothetical protein